jgi:predicted RNA binding protein YcfA (HicA-like mRNA interferase family)
MQHRKTTTYKGVLAVTSYVFRVELVSVRRTIRALEHEGFQFTERQGSQRVYRHPDRRRVVIHYHRPNDTLPPMSFAISSSAPVGLKPICAASASSPDLHIFPSHKIPRHPARGGLFMSCQLA